MSTVTGLTLLDPRVPDQAAQLPRAEAVRTVLLAERTAKDLGHWEVMAAAFAADAQVRVSWFQGRAADFVAGARDRADRGGTPSFHEVGPVSVVVIGDRALADAPCTVHIRAAIGGVEVDLASRGRLCWRVAVEERSWRIRSMDMIYIRDTLHPVPPAAVPALPAPADPRPSYRFLQAVLAGAGHPVSADLPGVDRPELVEQLLAEHHEWLFTTTTHGSRDDRTTST